MAVSRVRSAIFVDFDNIFLGLRDQDQEAAKRFAEEPQQWLSWIVRELGLVGGSQVDAQRDALLRRCYLSPRAFGRHRSGFLRAGFEVVDCPSLTSHGKNSADIRMVLDVIDALEHETRFDEFIIMSSDADFTPVFLRLRARDRRTVAITAGRISAAYRGACDVTVESEEFMEGALHSLSAIDSSFVAQESRQDLLGRMADELAGHVLVEGTTSFDGLPRLYRRFDSFRASHTWLDFYGLVPLTTHLVSLRSDIEVASDGQHIVPTNGAASDVSSAEVESLRTGVIAELKAIIAAHGGQVSAASAAHRLLKSLGHALRTSNWLGFGTFGAMVDGLSRDTDGISFDRADGGVIRSEVAHTQPEPTLDLTRRLNRLVNLPLLTARQYHDLFRAIADEGCMAPFNLTELSRSVRDRLTERGRPIARSLVGYVLKGLTFQKYPFELEEHDVDALATGFYDNILVLCRDAEYPIEGEEDRLLRTLFGLDEQPDRRS